ncbi:MAG: MarR family transcriptional regulator [Hornefia sp.]|nr:MarR family transcriptional regulator [Hornefia sp.]
MSYDSNEALKLDSQLCFPLYAASRKIIGAYTPLLKPLGITYTQYIVFMVLWEQDGITVGELGAKLRLDSGTLTPVLKKMESKGYVERKRSHDDERIVNIYLTEKGTEKKEEARDIPLKMGECFSLEEKEVEELKIILYKILNRE